jgi:hypothetical protein
MSNIKNIAVDATKIDTLNIRKMATLSAACDPTIPVADLVIDGPPVEINIVQREPQSISSGGADLITSNDVRTYYSSVIAPLKSTVDAMKAAVEATNAFQSYEALKQPHATMVESRPDSTTWTTEDRAMHDHYITSRATVSGTPEYQQYDAAATEYNEELAAYKQHLVAGFMENRSRGFLPSWIASRLH